MVHLGTMAERSARRTGGKQQRTLSLTRGSSLGFPNTAARLAKARQESKVNLRSASFTKEENADQFRSAFSSTSAQMTSR